MIALLFAALLADTPATVQTDDLTVSVLTMGPGDHPFFKFGHNALVVRDSKQKVQKVYNFGTFLFDSPLLIPEFLKGRLRYWLSVEALASTVYIYKHENRTILEQELALDPDAKRAIYAALETNALPENRYYKYDYYLDNCSTRIRDAVDRAAGGALHAASREMVPMTWRDHTRRATQEDLPVYLGLDIAMGSFIDKPIDQWEEMFLPGKLAESLRRAKLANGLPLVGSEKPLLTAPSRKPMKDTLPQWHAWFFLTGLGFAGLFMLMAKRTPRALNVTSALLGTLFALLGCIFIMFWVATDHAVAAHNENIFLCAPFAFLLWSSRLRVRVALAAAVLATAGLVFKVFPMANQHNFEFICFFVPFWLGLWFALSRGVRVQQRR